MKNILGKKIEQRPKLALIRRDGSNPLCNPLPDKFGCIGEYIGSERFLVFKISVQSSLAQAGRLFQVSQRCAGEPTPVENRGRFLKNVLTRFRRLHDAKI